MNKVSVIIPVYNAEKYLRECLDSVVNQTLKDIEIICVDDGSTDSSSAILAEYAAKDARVKVISQPKSNAGAARNAGLAVATGEYLGFVDSDDWCELALFEKAYVKAKADDADLVSWSYDQFDTATGRLAEPRRFLAQQLALPRPYAPDALESSVFLPLAFGPWARLVRRELVVRESVRFQSLPRFNDVCFGCLVLALSARQTLLNEVLYHYRVGREGNLQSGNDQTPLAAFDAWEGTVSELDARGLFQRFRNGVAVSAANSFFYAISTMPDAASYASFYTRLRSLYMQHPVFCQTKADDIMDGQMKTLLELLASCETALEFLVQQQKYYRSTLKQLWLNRAAGQQRLNKVQAELSALRSSWSYRIGRALLAPIRKARTKFRAGSGPAKEGQVK